MQAHEHDAHACSHVRLPYLPTQAHVIKAHQWPLTAVRKGYHVLVLLLFVPVLIVDAPMLVVSDCVHERTLRVHVV